MAQALAMPESQAISPLPQSRSAHMLEMIERALGKMSAEKLQGMMATFREIEADERRAAFHDAFANLMQDLPAIDRKGRLLMNGKDGKVLVDTKYARFEDIHRVVMPILTQHRFMLTFQTEAASDGKVRVRGILGHGGHEISSYYDLPLDTSGSKNNVQGVGSTSTYGKRYLALMMLNIRTEGEDTDAKDAHKEPSGPPVLSEEQLKSINAKLDKFDKDHRDDVVSGMLNWLGAESVATIKAEDYGRAVGALDRKFGAAKQEKQSGVSQTDKE